MSCIDVFNGDADGLCALHQFRLAIPCDDVTLVTGVKRDIELVETVTAKPGDIVTALDISFDKNRAGVIALLEQGIKVLYMDHHFAGDIPSHPLLQTRIDTDPEICTALLMNAQLQGKCLPWAVVGAFGDNLYASAEKAARPLGLVADQMEQLKQLGTLLNYNGYGSTTNDLHFHPEELYRLMKPYRDPFAFIAEEPAFRRLSDGFAEDMALAKQLNSEFVEETVALYILPEEAWSRRVSGVFGNALAQANPNRAHALLTRASQDGQGGFVVSVRAPVNNRVGADNLCRQFPSGGGRKAAAGINHLPTTDFNAFVDAFKAQYS